MHYVKNLVALHYNTKAKEMILTRFSSDSSMTVLQRVGAGEGAEWKFLLYFILKMLLYGRLVG